MRATRWSTRWALSALLVLAAAALLVGCGGDSDSDDDSGSTPAASTGGGSAQPGQVFGDADVKFAQQMIPHHQQAVDMARLARTRASTDQLKSFAALIKGEQSSEIDDLTDLLVAWGQEVPETMPGMVMSGADMPGMLTDQEFAALAATTGTEFDKMFLTLMIAHHNGSLPMAQAEVADGKNPTALDLAQTIVATQTAEIEQMQIIAAG